MAFKRLGIAFLSLTLGSFAGTAQALDFSLTGGGGQAHIGNGLMLPIQPAATAATRGTVFPNLKVPVKTGPAPIIQGTVKKPLIVVGTRSGYQRKLNIPVGVLSKPASQTTVGIKFSNAALYAAATNINYTWPAAPAVFSTGQPFGANPILAFGGSMTYLNTLGTRFGGAAQFGLTPGAPAGLLNTTVNTAPVTLYLKIGAATPPCAGCAPVGVIAAFPTPGGGVLGAGGATPTTNKTAGKALAPNVVIVDMGATPLGTILTPPLPAFIATGAVPTNMATSQPGPWTTGKLVVSMPAVGEKFTITGKDSRTGGGGGTIQLVSGALSTRNASGPNANRGWVQLELTPVLGVPSMSPVGLAATAALLLLTAGYAMRRRIFA